MLPSYLRCRVRTFDKTIFVKAFHRKNQTYPNSYLLADLYQTLSKQQKINGDFEETLMPKFDGAAHTTPHRYTSDRKLIKQSSRS